ncbi:MAG TPA: aminoacyl-tRNA hydrolase [Fusobacteria bacterium]|nr:aminoacyl-tRNA hydrolase [Fusobacteriota bacterium]|tara:strand:- start:17389 stop:17934 length:546 start_codon:yes stop_codon:yes gene_type:complete
MERLKTLFVGLGNPGNKFSMTRHNVGFMVMDKICKNLNLKFTKEHNALVARGDEAVFMKPQTFMNLSGSSLRSITQTEFFDKIVVVYDELDLPLGKIRIREKGRTTHNGVLSIMNFVDKFIRVRIGIGRSGNTKEYVLEKFSKEELAVLDRVLDRAVECLTDICNKKLSEVMNGYNGHDGT